jgi:hypothetical protein
MSKIDKTECTTEDWKLIKEQRRIEKQNKIVEANSDPVKKNKKIAFVIGNGNSRRSISLHPLKKHGRIYGCNALYRDFDPDILVAVDTKMILELNKARYQHRVPVWTNPNKSYAKMNGFNFFVPSKGWSSGPTALWKASEDGFEEIYILGFDYQGVGENYELVNNIYAGTINYKSTHDRATYYGNWLNQTVTTIQKNLKKRYIRVIEDRGFVPKEFSNLPNITHISVEDFKKIFDIN